tara:strand:- start:153 stop:539 length:387 start_codon:yes stop_codon:yes gene_type:complete
MIAALALSLGLAFAGECAEFVPIRTGQPLAASIAADGIARCDGVVTPLSDLAGFQALQADCAAADKLALVDIRVLEAEREWYKSELDRVSDVKWYQKPAAHRWAGRLDVVIISVVLTATAVAVQNAGK